MRGPKYARGQRGDTTYAVVLSLLSSSRINLASRVNYNSRYVMPSLPACCPLQELGGVMHRFDKDDDGTVDVVEFTKTFFKMGFDERNRRTRKKREAEAVRALAEVPRKWG